MRHTQNRRSLPALLLVLTCLLCFSGPASAQVGTSCTATNKVQAPTREENTNTAVICDGSQLQGLWSATASPLSVDFLGTVGIGTASPASRLEIDIPGGGGNAFAVRQSTIGSTGFAVAEDGSTTITGLNGYTGSIPLSIYGRSSMAAHYFDIFTSSSSPIFNIDSSGHVGIGTTNPQTSLDIETNAEYQGLFIGNLSNAIVELEGSSSGNDNGTLYLLNSGTTKIQIMANGSSYFNGGSVGIGTATPGATLDVNGHIGDSASGTPTVSSCGTSPPAVTGNDTRGVITYGTGTASTSCTLAFAAAYITAPYCIVSQYGAVTAGAVSVTSTSTMAMVLRWTTAVASVKFIYICMQ